MRIGHILVALGGDLGYDLYAFEHLMYTNGTSSDIKNRITNASRMLNIFGKEFALDIPVFRQ